MPEQNGTLLGRYSALLRMKGPLVDVLLLYPGEPEGKPRLPMSVLTLASYCIPQGLDCQVVDERLTPLEDQQIRDAKIIGISSMSGTQLKSAIATARRVRKLRPEVPIVWGGAHASAYPEQTARSPLVDYVVKGEGEQILAELCKRILNDQDVADLSSVTYVKDGTLVNNCATHEMIDVEDLPLTRYDLVDIKQYADFEDGFSYESSRGCPFRCTFCYVEYFHNRKWRSKSTEKVIAELRAIKKNIGVKKLYLIDDYFFSNRKRSLEICEAMIEANIDMTWTATARSDFLARCTDQEMQIIKDSGCTTLSIGAESGSDKILKDLKKDITAEQTRIGVQKCVAVGIKPTLSFIIGLPTEREEDLEATLTLCDDLMSYGEDVEINGLFVYVPYSGTPLEETATEYGYVARKELEEWADWSFGDHSNNPWLGTKQRKRLEAIASIARFKYMRHRFDSYSESYRHAKMRSPLIRLGYFVFVRVFAAMANLRWKRRLFTGALEWALWRKLTYSLFRLT
ncbi:MAG: B12-binding domain-containing radical SAM protein [Planctomycetes bacterium]|nr:B12-binding domain-containing radical SAM protein [Planctomycetota bacterium]